DLRVGNGEVAGEDGAVGNGRAGDAGPDVAAQEQARRALDPPEPAALGVEVATCGRRGRVRRIQRGGNGESQDPAAHGRYYGDPKGANVATILPPTADNVRRAAEALRRGELIGLPTETVYGLAANAFDTA